MRGSNTIRPVPSEAPPSGRDGLSPRMLPGNGHFQTLPEMRGPFAGVASSSRERCRAWSLGSLMRPRWAPSNRHQFARVRHRTAAESGEINPFLTGDHPAPRRREGPFVNSALKSEPFQRRLGSDFVAGPQQWSRKDAFEAATAAFAIEREVSLGMVVFSGSGSRKRLCGLGGRTRRSGWNGKRQIAKRV